MIAVRAFAAALAAAGILVASAPAGAATPEPEAALQTAVALDQGTMLSRIDAAFAAGALTFHEARSLYQEQAAIRAAWIDARARGDRHAQERIRFMLRTSQATLARLTYNTTQRVNIPLYRVATSR